jgi:hypothetical protein
VESINTRVLAEIAIGSALRQQPAQYKGSSLQSAHTVQEISEEAPKTGICKSSDIKKGHSKI